MIKKLLLIAFTSIILFGCAGTSNFNSAKIDTLPELQAEISKTFNSPLFENAHWGVLIKSLKTGKIWYEQNSKKMFMPASNEKIPTTASTLITLGPDFRFKTELLHNGTLTDSSIIGDIIVRGNGDPTLYNRFLKDPKDVFRIWAEDLRSLGVVKITGNIIGDDNAFDDDHIGYGWSFDGLDVWYSAEVGALQFNENYVDIKIFPPKGKGDSILIIPNVNSRYFNIINNLTVIDSGRAYFRFNRPYGTNNIYLNGTIKRGAKPFEFTPSLTNPTLFYVTVLKETFGESGITVEGNALDCDDIPGWYSEQADLNLLAVRQSPPLKEILQGLMKRSQNMYAETMVKLLGWNENGIGTFRNGKRVVERVLKGFGIDPDTYAYMDGSGLSRYNYISPEQLVKILEGMYNSEYKDVWIDLLPIAGVDGTLRNRMKGTKAEGNVRAKTGTISNVRGLSGYVTTADGEELVFSFLVNGHLVSTKDTEDVTDGVLKIISEYSNSN